MIGRTWILPWFWAVVCGLHGTVVAQPVDLGADAYRAGDHQRAWQHYRQQLAQGGAPSVDLLYSAGTAAAQLGRHGEAHWLLLRAQRRAPRDAEIAHNLEHVQRALELESPRGFFARAARISARFTTAELFWAAAGLQLLGLLGVVACVGRPRGAAWRRWAWAAVALGAAVWALAGARTLEPRAAVMIEDRVPLRPLPHEAEAADATLPVGALVAVHEHSTDWARISVESDGESAMGWVDRATLGLLEPR